MLKMIINNDNEKIVEVTNFFRGLDFRNDEVNFRFELNFTGNYSSRSIDYLAYFASEDIVSLLVEDKDNNIILNMENIHAKINNLYENYSDEGKNGSATIIITSLNTKEE